MAIKLTKKEAAELTELLGVYEAAKVTLTEFLTATIESWQSEWDGRSEKWQEGEAGIAAQERITELEANLDEVPGEGEPMIDPESFTASLT